MLCALSAKRRGIKTSLCFFASPKLSALAATDNYLYALSLNGANDLYLPVTDIQVFDWQGNPIKKYKTNQLLMRLCVDEANGKAYAIVYDNGDQNLVSFNL